LNRNGITAAFKVHAVIDGDFSGIESQENGANTGKRSQHKRSSCKSDRSGSDQQIDSRMAEFLIQEIPEESRQNGHKIGSRIKKYLMRHI
jgi:hypothetical protein